MGGIFLIDEQNQLVEMVETEYDSEAVLQELLAKHPSLLTGDSSREVVPRRWVLLKREAALLSEGGSSGTWSVDHLFVDQDAIPTLVEVKRSRNSEIRRTMVGQMLDYAANAVLYWPIEKLRATFEADCRTRNADPERVIAELLGRDDAVDDFWQALDTNLHAQRIRLLFVADDIPSELRRIIEFLNGQMSPAEVFGVEVRQFEGRGLRTLVPRVVGRTSEAESRKSVGSSPRRDDWSWEAYEQELNVPRHRIDVARAITKRVEEYVQRTDVPWTLTPRKGYFALLRPGGYKVAVIDVYWRRTPRFALRLPAAPAELGLASPYPELSEDWDPTEKEWGWTIPTPEGVPDLTAALDAVRPLHPAAGPIRSGFDD